MRKILLAIAIIIAITSSFALGKEETGKDKVLYLVSIMTKMPIGEILDDGLKFTRKDFEIRGILEVTTSYLGANTRADFSTAPKLVTVTFHWMTQESFRVYEKQAIEANEFNRASNGRSSLVFSYVQSYDATPSFSAIGENKTDGGVTWSFLIPRKNVRQTRAGDEILNLSKNHFGYGLDDVTVVLSGVSKAENGYLEEAEGVVTLVSNRCLPDVAKFFTVFTGLQQQNHVKNVMRPNGYGTFRMRRIDWVPTIVFKEDLEKYFYDAYDYSDVEVLDRLKQ